MSFFAFIIFLLLMGSAVSAQGLAERRAINEYKTEIFPGLQSEINTAAGMEVVIEVDWDKLASPGQAENYKQEWYITKVFFLPLIEALKKVASDDMGKDALKEKLKVIYITHDMDTAPASRYQDGVSFDNGKLSINFRVGSNSDDVSQRAAAIQKVLEDSL